MTDTFAQRIAVAKAARGRTSVNNPLNEHVDWLIGQLLQRRAGQVEGTAGALGTASAQAGLDHPHAAHAHPAGADQEWARRDRARDRTLAQCRDAHARLTGTLDALASAWQDQADRRRRRPPADDPEGHEAKVLEACAAMLRDALAHGGQG